MKPARNFGIKLAFALAGVALSASAASAVTLACQTGGSFGAGSATAKNDVVYTANVSTPGVSVTGYCGLDNNDSAAAVKAALGGGGSSFLSGSPVFFSDEASDGEAQTATFGIGFTSLAYPEVAFVLKQAQSFAVFLLDLSGLSTNSVIGTWQVGKVKSDGSTELKAINDISHASLYYRGEGFVPSPVPLPPALPLIGSAFVLMHLVRRRLA